MRESRELLAKHKFNLNSSQSVSDAMRSVMRLMAGTRSNNQREACSDVRNTEGCTHAHFELKAFQDFVVCSEGGSFFYLLIFGFCLFV